MVTLFESPKITIASWGPTAFSSCNVISPVNETVLESPSTYSPSPPWPDAVILPIMVNSELSLNNLTPSPEVPDTVISPNNVM